MPTPAGACYAPRTSSNVIGLEKEAMAFTQQQALTEARRRWGPTGAVRLRPPSPHQGRQGPGRLARYRYVVGNGGLGSHCTILGQGDSWSEAFDDARARPPSAGRVSG